MKRQGIGVGITGIIFCIGFGSVFDAADAACRQVLAPNGWQRITVCNNQGGTNYSGAVAAGVAGAAQALEVLPDVLNTFGNVTSGVGDLTSGVVSGLGDATANVTAPLGDANASGLNPFNLFNQQPDSTAAPAKKKNSKTENETPSLFGLFPSTPQVNAPTTNAPTVNAATPRVNSPRANTPEPQVNIFAPLINTATPRTNTPVVNTPAPQVNTPHIDAYR
jgi:hypothetical protein